jgi:hypothetical protein
MPCLIYDMKKEKVYKSVSGYSLDDLKHYHEEAKNFFAAELMMLKEVIPKITGERQAKAVVLLISCTQTGAALLLLVGQVDSFTNESMMLSRSFMEKITNFCYVSICDEKEFRKFFLHPIYKHYHNVGSFKLGDAVDIDCLEENVKVKKKKQEKLKKIAIVKEALQLFSDKDSKMNWTKKTLNQRIEALEQWGKFMDFLFLLTKAYYYSDASEALHGSLYGCSYNVGAFDPEFDRNKEGELDKKLHKDSACNLLHLGMLVHETLTLISYSTEIKELWKHSFENWRMASNLLYHILENKIPGVDTNG